MIQVGDRTTPSDLPRPARPDDLAEGGGWASCFYDVVRLRLTAHQTESGERTLQI